MSNFEFKNKLTEGIIKKRQGQFILFVDVNGIEYRCHCPTTGRVGDIELFDRPCLLSKSNDKKRTTEWTVEAISLNKIEDKNKKWIGINQSASNRYVEFYLKNNFFNEILSNPKNILREQFLGKSKLDFLVDNCFIEVKTPLHYLDLKIPNYIKRKKTIPFNSVNRFEKHIEELGNSLKSHQKAILLTVFLYDAPKFKVKDEWKSVKFNEVLKIVKTNLNKGVEFWQVNFKITDKNVLFNKLYKLDLNS